MQPASNSATLDRRLLYIKNKNKLGPVPEGRPKERERAVLTSRWSALECLVLARIARNIPLLTNRAQLSHTTNLPILTANRKKWRECSSLLPSSLSTVWNYIIILVRSSAGQRAETGNTDQTITSLENNQV